MKKFLVVLVLTGCGYDVNVPDIELPPTPDFGMTECVEMTAENCVLMAVPASMAPFIASIINDAPTR